MLKGGTNSADCIKDCSMPLSRGPPLMMSTKFLDFLTPPPCPHLEVIYTQGCWQYFFVDMTFKGQLQVEMSFIVH